MLLPPSTGLHFAAIMCYSCYICVSCRFWSVVYTCILQLILRVSFILLSWSASDCGGPSREGLKHVSWDLVCQSWFWQWRNRTNEKWLCCWFSVNSHQNVAQWLHCMIGMYVCTVPGIIFLIRGFILFIDYRYTGASIRSPETSGKDNEK